MQKEIHGQLVRQKINLLIIFNNSISEYIFLDV